ncbi:MAG: amino acid adenylation domain-containing protein, partial [bacterium]|nr:amino acid adenylation domain-containing protein [bacterium]
AVDMHHIISDGVSHKILAREFLQLYNGETLPPPTLQYKDFSQWHYGPAQQDLIKKQEQYWLQQFPTGDPLPLLQLPTDYTRPPILSNEGNTVDFSLEAKATARLKELAVKTDTTLYMLVLAMASILLTKLSGQEDIILGSPAAARRHSYLQDIIGMFVNTLVLRNFPSGNKTTNRFLSEVKTSTLEAMENQDYPFEQLAARLYTHRDPARNPVFDVMVSFLNTEEFKGQSDNPDDSPVLNSDIHHHESTALNSDHRDGETEVYRHQAAVSKFDLSIDAVDFGFTIGFRFAYCTGLYNAATIDRFVRYFKQVVDSVLENPDRAISSIDILSEEEKQRLLVDFNNTDCAYDRQKTIVDLFGEQVNRTPDYIALTGSLLFPLESTEADVSMESHREASPTDVPGNRSRQCSVTYRQLHEVSIRTAHLLINRGAGPGSIVAVMADRSIEMIAGLLGTLISGAAYMPILPDYPAKRIQYQLADSGTRLLLSNMPLNRNVPPDPSHDKITWDGDIVTNADVPPTPPPQSIPAQPRDPAYIIYTSGSTGRPKGVIVEHRQVVRLLVNDACLFDFNHRDTWTMFHSYCFDFSVWEMYGALLFGGRLVVVPELTAKDTADFLDLLTREQVTILNQTPSAFYNLVNEELVRPTPALNVRNVIFGGEALNPERLREWRLRYPFTQLINMYGITETTVHVTYKAIGDIELETGSSNIGKPIPTLRTYIMDRYSVLVPIGVTGELYVAGDGVARGYLNRPALTAEKFIDNPYKPGERLYRTGDLARFTPTGEMIYEGRMDQQVKIRGFRIEPGEIENRLAGHALIKQAVVITRDAHTGIDEKILCAYIVSKKPFDISQLRKYLLEELPDYMVPSFFIHMDHIPLTDNGKVDRKKLPAPNPGTATDSYSPPETSIQHQLAAIWAKILGMEKHTVGIDSDFFAMGGHSLSATTLASRIHKDFNIAIPLLHIFTFPTIREIAQYLIQTQNNGRSHTAIPVAEKKEYYELSPAQQRIYFNQTLNENSTIYNMPQVIPSTDSIDIQKVETTFKQLIHRHESLRTSFHMVADSPVQRI